MSVRIIPGTRIPTTLLPPVSKSDAIRERILAAIHGAPPQTLGPPEDLPRDVRVVEEGLVALAQGDTVTCGDAGAPLRFLLVQAALVENSTTRFVGTARLFERPLQPLLDSLAAALGTRAERTASGLILHSPSRAPGPLHFALDAGQSGQFLSALLLGGARLKLTVDVAGSIASEGYVDLTCAWLTAFGRRVRVSGRRWSVEPGSAPFAKAVPADWSAGAALLPIAWKCGGRVAGLELDSQHPDASVASVLREAGLKVTQVGGEVSVAGELARGFDVDAARCPDAVPALAAWALMAPGATRIRHTDILRGKESDRLEGVIDLFTRAGGAARTEVSGTLTLLPPVSVQAFSLQTLGDHRRAMAAAVASVVCAVPVDIDDAACVKKSFPAFFRELEKAGVSAR